MSLKEEIISQDTFIAGWYLKNTDICDSLIELWKNSNTEQGTVNIKGNTVVDKEFKESIELKISPNTQNIIFQKYIEELKLVAAEYIRKYPWSNEFSPWSIIDSVNIQYYPQGGGFKSWHTERSSGQHPYASRHLVFMTYLNDVDSAGTEFLHQNTTISAKKGLTIIWPADWTHVHRGIVSKDQEKWIITGWFNYLN